MDPLVGKIIKADRSLDLEFIRVDGEMIYPDSFFIPRIYRGGMYRVKSVDNDVVTLQNLHDDDWIVCEVNMDVIDTFKVASQYEVDML